MSDKLQNISKEEIEIPGDIEIISLLLKIMEEYKEEFDYLKDR